MGEPTLREEIARIVDPDGWKVIDAYRPQFDRANPGISQNLVAEWQGCYTNSLTKADQILALLDRRVPTLSPGNQEDSLSRDHAPSITGGPLDRAAIGEAEDCRSAIENLARRHYAASNAKKARDFERKAHAHAYAGVFEALQVFNTHFPRGAGDGGPIQPSTTEADAVPGTPSNLSPTLSPEGSGDE